MDYDELFSCFGNRALDIIFNMDASKLPGHEIDALIRLVDRMKHDDRLTAAAAEALSEEDDDEKLRKLLAVAAS